MTTKAVAAVAATALVPCAPAWAGASTRIVCVARASVYDTPGAFVVGRVRYGQHVRVMAYTRSGLWVRVRGKPRLVGWVRIRVLC